jgi:hypothetical protein
MFKQFWRKLSAIALMLITPLILMPQIIGPAEIDNENWGFKFELPAGWEFRQDQTGGVLTHESIPGQILIIPNGISDIGQLRDEMSAGLEDEGTDLILESNLESDSTNTLIGDYIGIYEYQQVKARAVGTFSSSGGAYIIAITSPDEYGAPLAKAAQQIAESIHYRKSDTLDLATYFIGRWVAVSANELASFALAPDSNYYEHTLSSENNSSYNLNNDTDMMADSAHIPRAGRWVIRGNKENGRIIITKSDGGQKVLKYKLYMEIGRGHRPEYWFNGSLYSKQQ